MVALKIWKCVGFIRISLRVVVSLRSKGSPCEIDISHSSLTTSSCFASPWYPGHKSLMGVKKGITMLAFSEIHAFEDVRRIHFYLNTERHFNHPMCHCVENLPLRLGSPAEFAYARISWSSERSSWRVNRLIKQVISVEIVVNSWSV